MVLRVERLRICHLGPLSLTLDAQEIVILQGPSGAGKTLLLRALADLDPNTGHVRLNGEAREEIPAVQWRLKVALLPSESYWWFGSVGEHFPSVESAHWAALGFDEAVLAWPVTRLSSGERQRLALLRLLANRPSVLLLDEPTANLDRDNALRVEALVRHYLAEKQAAALWVSHDAAQVQRIASRVLSLENGSLT
jgi:putative ABC transport system ATP-binding protein